jgi:cyclopropane fatty-acyl-phospholipid synthase-like methyltransferase
MFRKLEVNIFIALISLETNAMKYQSRIYANYASVMQDSVGVFDGILATRWGAAYGHYLRKWLPVSKQAAIADLACGSGKLLHFFKECGYTDLQGVDLSPSQVRLARQVVPSVQEGSLFEFLRSRPAAFDLITGLDIIEHLSKDEVLEFLDACNGALKPGGRLVLQTPNAETPWGSALRYADFTHQVCFTPDCLGRLLSLCGFEHVAAREMGPVPLGYSWPSTARFVLWSGLRSALRLWNRIESGGPGSGIFTRVFIVSALKAARTPD